MTGKMPLPSIERMEVSKILAELAHVERFADLNT
jgi:hypothetical protein